MTIIKTLSRARDFLAGNNVEDAALESEVLLRHALKIDRARLFADLNIEVSPGKEKTFWRLIKRRLDGEPTTYITGHREFYGVDFYVNRHVLIPRPETELLVEKAISLAQNRSISTIADVGTGCGAIVISLALELPEAKIYATDISASALDVALTNCQKHGVAERIHLLQGDMLEPLPEPVDLIISNLPYIREPDLPLTEPANFEPIIALNGGPDGLEKIRQLCQQLDNRLHHDGCLLMEIGQGQKKAITSFLYNLFPSAKIDIVCDLNGIERVVCLTLSNMTACRGDLACTD